MKRLLFILFIISFGPTQSQNLYTNEPDLVYPILEEFIAENFKNKVPTFYLINTIDSINVEWLDYPLYGVHIKSKGRSVIKIHRWLKIDKKRFERTLKHELGHVFNLPHISCSLLDGSFLEFMSSIHYEEVGNYYTDQKIWNRVNHNYYKSIQNNIK